MQHDGDRRALFLGRLVTAFQATGRTGENDLWHTKLHLDLTTPVARTIPAPIR